MIRLGGPLAFSSGHAPHERLGCASFVRYRAGLPTGRLRVLVVAGR